MQGNLKIHTLSLLSPLLPKVPTSHRRSFHRRSLPVTGHFSFWSDGGNLIASRLGKFRPFIILFVKPISSTRISFSQKSAPSSTQSPSSVSWHFSPRSSLPQMKFHPFIWLSWLIFRFFVVLSLIESNSSSSHHFKCITQTTNHVLNPYMASTAVSNKTGLAFFSTLLARAFVSSLNVDAKTWAFVVVKVQEQNYHIYWPVESHLLTCRGRLCEGKHLSALRRGSSAPALRGETETPLCSPTRRRSRSIALDLGGRLQSALSRESCPRRPPRVLFLEDEN